MGDLVYISRSTARKILKTAGASRISDSAITAFQNKLNKVAYDAASKSIRFAKHAKRKTIDVADVQLAMNS